MKGENPGNNSGRHSGGRPSAGQIPQQNNFSVNAIFVSVSNYIAFIVLCSIIVYIIDKGTRKRDRIKRPPSVAGAS